MASSNFVDYVKIFCRSGKGGAGSRHFIRTKRTPKGGPDGGDGGRGGHIILEADKKKNIFRELQERRRPRHLLHQLQERSRMAQQEQAALDVLTRYEPEKQTAALNIQCSGFYFGVNTKASLSCFFWLSSCYARCAAPQAWCSCTARLSCCYCKYRTSRRPC